MCPLHRSPALSWQGQPSELRALSLAWPLLSFLHHTAPSCRLGAVGPSSGEHGQEKWDLGEGWRKHKLGDI